jgi:hypothetical protein
MTAGGVLRNNSALGNILFQAIFVMLEEKFFGREPGLIRYWVLRALGATATALGVGR